MQESRERHLVVRISWQSDGWKFGPTVEDMMNSTMSQVKQAGEKIYELLKIKYPEKNEEEIKKIIVNEDLLEKLKELMPEEDKQSIFIPLESKLFNLETDIEEEDSKKWKKSPIHLDKNPKDFDNEKGIIFFVSNKQSNKQSNQQLVGLYAFAKLYLENNQHYIKAPLEYCIKFDVPISFDEIKDIESCSILDRWRQGIFRYINDHCAFQILETAYKKGNKFDKLLDIIDTLKKEIGDQPDNELELGEQKEDSKKVNSLTLQEYFQYEGFYFDQALITAFYSALKTKGFVILSGLTGTGKTKLAQLFAELFEIEKIKEKTDEKYLSFTIEVSPYMLQYNRIHLPKRSYEILNLVDTEKEKYIKVVGGNEEENCKIVKYAADRYPYTLLLKGKVAKWFKDNFKEKEKLQIEVVPTEDNENVILVLKKLEPEKRQIEKKPAYIFLSVKPDWRDSNALLGYYNPITGKYEKTSLLDFILDAINNYNTKKDNADPFFIILDEMNLSHVEYYFADFLSVLESGRDENYWTKEAIKLHSYDNSDELLLDNNEDEIPKEIKLPPNLYIIGSVNIDETTYMFSPKVLDRAFTIEFREVNFDKYLASMQNGQINISEDELKKLLEPLRDELLKDLRNNGKFCAVVADKNEIKNAINELDPAVKAELNQLNQILQLYDLHFGYRVLDEIALFITYAMNAPDKVVKKLEKEQALDFAVLMKVLPKFHGPRQKLEIPLWLVLKWCAKNSVDFENVKPEVIKNLLEELLKEKEKRSEKFKYPRTAIKVLTMLRQLYETGFTSFA
jgi:5-methylcytosine-specific restriction endonuclease McrBC GTP-binding regulatory subunit McrB